MFVVALLLLFRVQVENKMADEGEFLVPPERIEYDEEVDDGHSQRAAKRDAADREINRDLHESDVSEVSAAEEYILIMMRM